MPDIEVPNPLPAFLFVYGTLKRSPDGEMHPLLKKGAEFIGCAKVHGRIYQREGYPGLVTDRGPETVSGELYRVLDSESLLPRLDAYEGCAAEAAGKNEFLRASVEVETERRNKMRAWVYLLTETPEERFLIPEGVYRG